MAQYGLKDTNLTTTTENMLEEMLHVNCVSVRKSVKRVVFELMRPSTDQKQLT